MPRLGPPPSATKLRRANKPFKGILNGNGHWNRRFIKKLKRMPEKNWPKWKRNVRRRKLRKKPRSMLTSAPKIPRSELKRKPRGPPNKRRLNSQRIGARRRAKGEVRSKPIAAPKLNWTRISASRKLNSRPNVTPRPAGNPGRPAKKKGKSR